MIGAQGHIALAFATGLVSIVALAAAVQGWLMGALHPVPRGAIAGAALLLLHGDWRTDVAGVAGVGAIVTWQRSRRASRGGV